MQVVSGGRARVASGRGAVRPGPEPANPRSPSRAPTPRPFELGRQQRETRGHDEHGGSRRHDHQEADCDESAAEHADGDAPRELAEGSLH